MGVSVAESGAFIAANAKHIQVRSVASILGLLPQDKERNLIQNKSCGTHSFSHDFCSSKVCDIDECNGSLYTTGRGKDPDPVGRILWFLACRIPIRILLVTTDLFLYIVIFYADLINNFCTFRIKAGSGIRNFLVFHSKNFIVNVKVLISVVPDTDLAWYPAIFFYGYPVSG